jgi:Flp pilus assembly CpaF family ATPase
MGVRIMPDKIPYEDLVIPNLVDPAIGTLSRHMAQYLVDNIHKGKNIIITGSASSGRTLLLNVIGKHISFQNNLMCMEVKPDLLFLEHEAYHLNVSNLPLDKRTQEYFFITKGFPHYEEYSSFVLDDLPRSSFVNYYRLLLAKKQSLVVINDENNDKVLNNLLYILAKDIGVDQIDDIGVNLMEHVDILVHIRKYEDDYIRIKEISEPQQYVRHEKRIVLEKIYEFMTNGQKDPTGRLVGDFIKY